MCKLQVSVAGILLLSCALGFGCNARPQTAVEPPSIAPLPGTPDTAYPPDVRVSPHGRVRPTLAATTDTEEVHYSNTDTGTEADYDLEVDRDEEGHIERINFPTGGWKEIRGEVIDNEDGTETYTDERSHEFTVTKPDEIAEAQKKKAEEDGDEPSE